MARPDNSSGAGSARPRPSRGIALLMVLWVLTLLALMAATFTRATRTETNLARNLLENAQAEALADAGVRLAAAKLMQPVADGGWSIDGQVHGLALGGGEVRVVIADEGGKIDLNLASEDLLQALFRALDQGARESAALADAILDFRDPDGLRRLNGAEDEDYGAAGVPHDAKDGPFEAVAELQQVIGMSAELYRQLAPVVTVHGARPLPDQATAPPLVVAALTGQQGEAPAAETEAPGGSGSALRSRIGTYAVHAEGRTAGGALFARAAVLRLVGRPGTPFQVLEWRQGRRALFGAEVDPED